MVVNRPAISLVALFLFSFFPALALADVPVATNVTITGTAEVGQLLNGDYVYSDADGDIEGASTFRWLRGATPIGGATLQSYTLVEADLNAQIVFEVTPVAVADTGAGGGLTGVPVPSVPTAPVAPANTAPTATNVSISGTPEVGFTLTGSYTYNDADGDPEGTSTFRWRRNGNPIGGATSINYTLVGADVGDQISFEVTPVAQTGVSPGTPVQSAPTVPVVPANTAPTATNVAISGTAEAGFTLTGSYTYNDADGDLEGASTFRWLRNGNPIGGATSISYTLVGADVGNPVRFEVTPVAQTGVSPGTAVQSAPTAPVAPANTAPTATNVSISGTPSIGETLSGNYTYSDADGDTEGASTYRWLRNGAPIGGATSTNYVVVQADVGTTLQFEVTPVAQTGVSPGVPVVSSGVAVTNTAPLITGQVPLSTPEETALTLQVNQLTIDDPDSTQFTLAVQPPPPGANYTRNGNTITPVLNYNGPLSVPVTVNDGASDSPVFNVVVSVTPVNDVPQITGQQALSTPEDTSLQIVLADVIVVDPDNPPGDLTLTILPGTNYTVANNVVTPALNFNGNLSVGAQVSDGLATSATTNLVVSVTAVNDLPRLSTPIGSQSAIEASPFNLNISGNFNDDDGDDLTYTASGLPPSGNITFNTQTGVFSGTPRFEDARDNDPYSINVTASDGKPGSMAAADTFDLNISALDRANVSLDISATPDPAMLNDELRWTFTARNAAGPQAAANVQLSGAFIGSGLTVSSTANCSIQAEVNQVTSFECTVGGLPVNASTAIVLTTATSAVGDVLAFAIAEGADPVPIDPNLDDNSAQLAIGVAEAFSNGAVQILGNGMVRSVALGDVDGDDSPDLVAGTSAGQPVQVWISSGFRDFAGSPIQLADPSVVASTNEGVALADFDEDGALDLVVATGGGQSDLVFRNNGSGIFAPMATLSVATFANDVATGDFNNDGNQDIAIAANGGNPIYHGNGNGGFNLQRQIGNANSQDVAVADFNNDGNDDVVFANIGSSSRIYSGGTTSTLAELAIGDATSVAVGQFGGNARPDLVFGRVPTDIGDVPANPVLINGDFATPLALLGAAPTFDVQVGDVDQDGNDDVVFVNSSGVHQIWNANGAGGFELHPEQIVAEGAVAGAVAEFGFTDVGDPGGVDLAMGGLVQPGLGVFLNDGFGNLGRGDAVPPVLSLLGSATIEVPSGSAYVDAGASAEDNIDGNISGSIRVSNPVNTSIVGAYTVTYNVSDFAGNDATPVTRTVNVTPAAGTGGGGGGALSYWFLLCLFAGFAAGTFRRDVRPVQAAPGNGNTRMLKS